ncbi:MAG: ABC transporter permease [Acidimicrobiales bacterium]
MAPGQGIGAPALRRLARTAGPAAAIIALQLVVFPMPAGVLLVGVVLGLLGALVAVGMALVHRANRILNFAQSDLGFAPAALAANLILYSGFSYLLGAAIGAATAVVLGAVVELAVIRRFFRASRLVLTVATIGLSQLLAVTALALPRLWGEQPNTLKIAVPLRWSFEVAPLRFSADHVVALVVAPLALVAMALFLRCTAVGVAVRASAERADRASLLGVPVRRLQTLVWAVAALLSFTGIYLRAGVVGLPALGVASFGALLFALAAVMLGRLDDLPAVALSAVALGILEQGVLWNNPRNPEYVYPVVAAVVVVALGLRRTSTIRVEQDDSSSWRSADEIRPVPHELRALPEVRAVTWGGLALVSLVLLSVPVWIEWLPGERGGADLRKAAAVAIFGLVGLSVIVLTGWAGQVSLGQMAIAGYGGAVGALAASSWGLDLGLAMLASGMAGGLLAVVIGLPALRIRGLFLAVVTFAFALASSFWLLSPKHFRWIPGGRFERPALFGFIDTSSDRTMYLVALATLGLALLAIRGVRRSRTGRVLLAQRENERAVQAYGVNLTRTKLTAFALSGATAAIAGCLLTVLQQQFSPALYEPGTNFGVFTSAVVGGLGSLVGALLGALYLQGGTWFLPPQWQLLPSAVGVLLVLMVFPGGLAGVLYRLRDRWLRSVARRRGIVVPSLLADLPPEPVPRQATARAPASTTDGAVGRAADPAGATPEVDGRPVPLDGGGDLVVGDHAGRGS